MQKIFGPPPPPSHPACPVGVYICVLPITGHPLSRENRENHIISTQARRHGGGGGGMVFLFCYACQDRSQSCSLMMILPLPHYDNFATTFFSFGKNMLEFEPPPPPRDFFRAGGAGGAASRHFATPNQTPWHRPCIHPLSRELFSPLTRYLGNIIMTPIPFLFFALWKKPQGGTTDVYSKDPTPSSQEANEGSGNMWVYTGDNKK